MIGGMAKAYGWTPEYVLYDLSYANLIMYSAVLPSYNKEKKDKDGKKITGMSTKDLFDTMKQLKQ